MTTLVLLRHGRSSANVAGVLAGRTPGVELDDLGREQAAKIAGRLSSVTFDALVSSPMDRCRQTIAPVAAAPNQPVIVDDAFAEVDYGDWTGKAIKDLAGEPLWRTVQAHPAAAVFPGGEGLAAMSTRAVAGVRRLLADLGTMTGEGGGTSDGNNALVLLCSHGDVIKAILADALGLHLDGFQRIVVNPASLSVVRYTALRPFVERVNDGGELGTLRPQPAAPTAETSAEDPTDSADAVVGGGA